jgi:LysR family hydrogen peroxide-inducible transcriptional activator
MGVTLIPEAAADALVQPRGPVELAAFSKPPGRTLGLAWRTSSARLREFRLLAEVMSEASDKFLSKMRA